MKLPDKNDKLWENEPTFSHIYYGIMCENSKQFKKGGFMVDSAFIDYDDSLIGRIPYIDAYNFYGTNPGGPNERKALACIRYALEDILCWTPEESILKFDDYVIHEMKLEKVISYIDFPIEVPYGNAKYILSLLYPDKIKLNQQKLVEETFQSVLDAGNKSLDENGEKKSERLKQFPREYFAGGQGFKRFCYCIKYIIENYKPMSSVEEVYHFFTSPSGKKMLYDFRLKVPADQFSINMLSVLRYITSEEPDGELYYCYYTFLSELNELCSVERELQPTSDKSDSFA